MKIKQRKQDDTHHEENASISTRKKNKKTRRRNIRSPHHTHARAAASSQLGFQPARLVPLGVTLVGVGGDGTSLVAMSFSIPPRPTPPAYQLDVEGVVFQPVLPYASNVLHILLPFLLLAICFLLVLPVRLLVFLPLSSSCASGLKGGSLSRVSSVAAGVMPCAAAKHCPCSGVPGHPLHTCCVRPLPQGAQGCRMAPRTGTCIMLIRASLRRRWHRMDHCQAHMPSVP